MLGVLPLSLRFFDFMCVTAVNGYLKSLSVSTWRVKAFPQTEHKHIPPPPTPNKGGGEKAEGRVLRCDSGAPTWE